MTKITSLITLLFTFLIISCSNENIEDIEYQEIKDPNFRVSESTVIKSNNLLSRTSLDEPCMSVDLIAGQNETAGTVSVDVCYDNEDYPEGNLIITYNTNDGWTIGLTHLSLGDCAQHIPTTGSDNPKVGKFEHKEPHSTGTNKVEYYVSLDAVPEPFYNEDGEYIDNYCFAAHAEVTGPTGEETAWAEGTPFDGNSWAMYVPANLSACDVDTDCDRDVDMDCDGIPNEEDLDKDGDGVPNKAYDEDGNLFELSSIIGDLNYDSNADNCADIPNEDQIDLNGDGIGDACKPVK